MTAATTGIEDNKNTQSFANSPSIRETGHVVDLVFGVIQLLVTHHSHYVVNSLACLSSLYLYSSNETRIDF